MAVALLKKKREKKRKHVRYCIDDKHQNMDGCSDSVYGLSTTNIMDQNVSL